MSRKYASILRPHSHAVDLSWMHDDFVHVEPSRPAAILEQLHFVLDPFERLDVSISAAKCVRVVAS